MVLMLESAGRRILLMSDSGFGTEQWLIDNDTDLRADILIKGQHAKDISGTGEFLDRVKPLAIVVSADDLRRPNDAFGAWADTLKSRTSHFFARTNAAL
jgi:beta-lactamase superfamily II metal-dependent hydrolase